MALQVFINFNGNCREAVTFYAKVFKAGQPQFMTYGEAHAGPGEMPEEKDRNRIMFTSLPISGATVMFCDVPSDVPCVQGDHISLTVVDKDQAEIRRLFGALSEGGRVEMELQETFWSDLYGMATDRFGINWQFSHDSGKEY